MNRQVSSFPQKFSRRLISLLFPLWSASSVLHAVCDGADTLSCHASIAPAHLDTVENLWDLEDSGPNLGITTY